MLRTLIGFGPLELRDESLGLSAQKPNALGNSASCLRSSPPGTAVHTKDELRPKFLEQFGGELSRRAFDRAWIEAGKENIAYATAGRRKSRQ